MMMDYGYARVDAPRLDGGSKKAEGTGECTRNPFGRLLRV